MFKNRKEAGGKLADRLIGNQLIGDVDKKDLLVLSIPRGGVVVGKEVARVLKCDHDVVVSKKLGAPMQKELAIGAVAEDGEPWVNEQLVASVGVDRDYLKVEEKKVRGKIRGYIDKFREGRELDVGEKVVIVVDDGFATGATAKAAIKWLRNKKAGKVVVAVPVCAKDTARELERQVDKWVCLDIPPAGGFAAVGQFYSQFDQVSDEEVVKLLHEN